MAKDEGYEALAASQDDEDRAHAAAVRARQRGHLDPAEEGALLLSVMSRSGLSAAQMGQLIDRSEDWVNERVALVPAEEREFDVLIEESTLNSPAAQHIRSLRRRGK